MRHKPNIAIIQQWHSPKVAKGIGRYAREVGWHLSPRQVISGTDIQRTYDGVLSDAPLPEKFRGVPAVMIGANHADDPECSSVSEDDIAAGRLAASHLLQQGHRRFIWFSIFPGNVESRRREGFHATLAEAGCSCADLRWFNATRQSGWQVRLVRVLRRMPRPVAIGTVDDTLAAEVIEACMEAVLTVPTDVAVVSFGNIDQVCDHSIVPITSVDLDNEALGYRAAVLLDRRLRRPRHRPVTVVVPLSGLLVRASTAMVLARNPRIQAALRCIDANLHKPIGTIDVARSCGLSLRGLEAAFMRDLRQTPAKFLLDHRLAKAEHLLATSDLPIQAIADSCGFGTLRTFYRCFQRRHRGSPRTFRNERRDPQASSTSPARPSRQVRSGSPRRQDDHGW